MFRKTQINIFLFCLCLILLFSCQLVRYANSIQDDTCAKIESLNKLMINSDFVGVVTRKNEINSLIELRLISSNNLRNIKTSYFDFCKLKNDTTLSFMVPKNLIQIFNINDTIHKNKMSNYLYSNGLKFNWLSSNKCEFIEK